MEAITIPSPTAFLPSPSLSKVKKPTPTSLKNHSSKEAATAAAAAVVAATQHSSTGNLGKGSGTTRPKQSKSRNGCITCKAKRLKCDETKPNCQQCRKRGVQCGGYKKDFKWRPFEEATFVTKNGGGKNKRFHASSPVPKSPNKTPKVENPTIISPTPSDMSYSPASNKSTPTQHSFIAASSAPQVVPIPSPGFMDGAYKSSPQMFGVVPTFDGQLNGSRKNDFDHISDSGNSLFDNSATVSPAPVTSQPTDYAGALTTSPADLPYQPTPILQTPADEDNDVEEIIRHPNPSQQITWNRRISSPSPSSSSGSSEPSVIQNPFYRQPITPAGSPEMLMLRYDKQTCGILSIKDGPTENPWRTLIWPLARESTALYHAIASMTAFHTSREQPSLRVEGMEHMRRSIRSLATGIGNMRTDTALATTLALAFSESWDQHISTGIEHLRGARILVKQALAKHRESALGGDNLARLRFLCNTWVYMDVIARLTSVDEDEGDFEAVLAPLSYPLEPKFSTEIDPLMGCASSLFPLIGKATNLVRRIRKTDANSVAIISQAMDLKSQIESWLPATFFDNPEDPTSAIQDSVQTAEAYRYATLLYLHQAVPEIPSPSSAELANKVLVLLATVPITSRVVIVHIYPLLVAGCEAADKETREWVTRRWKEMSQRMWIGNVDRCLEVVQEVWARRDVYKAEKKAAKKRASNGMMSPSKRKFQSTDRDVDGLAMNTTYTWPGTGYSIRSSPGSAAGLSFTSPDLNRSTSLDTTISSTKLKNTDFPDTRRSSIESITGQMDPEMTVRGRLHWVGVMEGWNWEILLG